MERRKIVKRILIGLVSVLALFILLSGGIGMFMVNYSLKTPHRGQNIGESYEQMYERYPHVQEWVDSLKTVGALKDTTIINYEGKRLHGYYVDAAVPTKNTALVIHGYTDNAIRMFMIGHLYNKELDYNIIIPDLQFHGMSEGDAVQMGWKDRLDVLEWANIALTRYGSEVSILLHGISMGAATTMMVSGTEQLEQIKCYVADCGYTSVWDEFSQELSVRFGLPEFPILHTASLICDLLYDWNFKEASALESVKKSNKPMLFIHGDIDTFVPTWMVYDLYEAKSHPKELWVIKDAEHAVSYLENKDEYTLRVANFVGQYMN